MEKHKPFGWGKEGNIKRRTYEEENKKHEPSFRRRSHGHTNALMWMQRATKHPGRTRAYLAKAYGSAAFNPDGTINLSVLNEAIEKARRKGKTELERRLVLARTYKTDGGR